MLIRNTIIFISIVSLDKMLLPSQLVNILILRIFQQSENTVEIWKSFWSARDTWHVWIVFDTRDEVSWPGEVSRYHHLLSWSSSWYHWCSCSSQWYSQSVQLNLQNYVKLLSSQDPHQNRKFEYPVTQFLFNLRPMFPPSSYKKLTSMSQVNQTLHSSPRQW